MKTKLFLFTVLSFVIVFVDPFAPISFEPLCGAKTATVRYDSSRYPALLSVRYQILSGIFSIQGWKTYFPYEYRGGEGMTQRWFDKKSHQAVSSPKATITLTEESETESFDETKDWSQGAVTRSVLEIHLQGGTGIDDWLFYKEVVETINRLFALELPVRSYRAFRFTDLERSCVSWSPL